MSSVTCGNCGTPFPEQELTNLVRFPSDARTAITFASGRLNWWTCAVCSHTASVIVPIIAVHEEWCQVAIYGLNTTQIRNTLRAMSPEVVERFQVREIDDYIKLMNLVQDWIEELLKRATAPLFTDGDAPTTADGLKLYLTKPVLLTMKAQSEGQFPLELTTHPPLPPEDQREFVRGLLTAAIEELVNDLYQRAFHQTGLHTYLELLEAHLDPDCFVDDVFPQLVANCKGWDETICTDAWELSSRFRAEYINAVAHVAADRENPRSAEWARLMLEFFLLDQRPDVEFSMDVLLTPEVLGRTIRFEDLWDLSGARIGFDGESKIQTMFALFSRFGHIERFIEETRDVPIWVQLPDKEEESAEHLAQRVLEILENLAPEHAPDSMDCDEFLARAVADQVRLHLRYGRPDSARALALLAIERARSHGQPNRFVQLVTAALEVFNQEFATEAAASVVMQYATEAWAAVGDLDRLLMFRLMLECGNVSRYAAQYEHALKIYDAAESACKFLDDPASQLPVIQRNRAIVLRRLGRFDEVLELIQSVRAVTIPGSVEAVHMDLTVALTYLEAHLYREAAQYADAATAIPLSRTHSALRVNVLLARATVNAELDPVENRWELDEALHLVEQDPRQANNVASAILTMALRANVRPEVITRAVEILEEARCSGTFDIVAAVSLGNWYLAQNDLERARQVTGDCLTELDQASPEGLPWQAIHLQARLIEPSDTKERWQKMLEAVRLADTQSPEADLRFRRAWTRTNEELRSDILAVARQALIDEVAAPVELAEIFEFCNGREISRPAIGDKRTDGSVTALLDTMTSASKQVGRVCIVLFFEDGESLSTISLRPTSQEINLKTRVTSIRPLAEAAKHFASEIGFVLPGLSQTVEATLDAPLQILGDLLAELSEPGEHLCVLRCDSLLGLPLQAVTMKGGSLLLERNTMSFAPNLRVLGSVLSSPAAAGQKLDRAALIMVSKATDKPAYVERSKALADQICSVLAAQEVSDLRGTDATKVATLGQMESVDHCVFICHGADGGRLRGRGVCVSDGLSTPPSLLPVEQDQSLRRFVIDGVDLETLKRVPATVVSMSCSSGRTLPGAGGTRIGLTGALLAKGTRTILAPQWHVDQVSAVQFLDDFYRLQSEHVDWHLGEVYRQSMLAARCRYEDIQRWAPFALLGSWLR